MTPITLLFVFQLSQALSYSVSPFQSIFTLHNQLPRSDTSLSLLLSSSVSPLCLEKPSPFQYIALPIALHSCIRFYCSQLTGMCAHTQPVVFLQLWLMFSLCPTCCSTAHVTRLNSVYSPLRRMSLQEFNNTLCPQ